MGASQQRTCQVWITVSRNSKSGQNQLFDFNKQRLIVSSSKVFFPSYLHYYEQSKLVTFSLLEDYQNEFAVLDYRGRFEKELTFTKISSNISGRVWKLLKDDDGVQLEEGDFIKLGRIQLEVKELLFTNKKSTKNLLEEEENKPQTLTIPTAFNHNRSLNNSNYMKNSDIMSKFAYSRMKDSDVISLAPSDRNMKNSIFTERSSNELCCRFCFDGSSSKRNPLFNVCKCAGSVKNIHYQCLKSWVKNKMGKIETSHCIYYHYQPLVCQICKQAIKNDIIHEGRLYKLFQPQKMHPPYARFEHFQDNKVFQILIRLQESSNISIGRGPENELNLNDSSISRLHSSLFYTSRKLFLKGKSSKYGTFVELSKNMQLKPDQTIELLIQNNLISIDRKSQPKGFFQQQCCSVESSFKLIVK